MSLLDAAYRKIETPASGPYFSNDVIRRFGCSEVSAGIEAAPAPNTRARLDEELVDYRRQLLEGGRADVDNLLRDLSDRYTTAIYYRDVEISQLRVMVTRLQEQVEDAKLAADGAGEAVSEAKDALTQVSENTRVIEADMKKERAEHEATKKQLAAYEAKVAKYKNVATVAKSNANDQLREINDLRSQLGRLKTEGDQQRTTLKEEQRRSDYYYRSLRKNTEEGHELAVRLERMAVAPDAGRDVAEALRLQTMTNHRLLSVLAFLATPDGAAHAQSIAKTIHTIGASDFQFIGGSTSAPATIMQDIEAAIQDFNSTTRHLASGIGSKVHPPLEPYRSLHVERDRWVPREAVAALRHFQTKYFPNARPDLFYGLLMQLAVLFRDLSGHDPADELLKRVDAAQERAKARYGLHDHKLNAPQSVRGERPPRGRYPSTGADFTKKSCLEKTLETYYSSSGSKGGLSAVEHGQMRLVSRALEGVRLVLSNVSSTHTHTLVTLQRHTVDECLRRAEAALEEFALSVRQGPSHAGGGGSPHLGGLFEVVQDSSSRAVQLCKGTSDAATHLTDALQQLLYEVEGVRRTHTVGQSAEISGPYALLKNQVKQVVARYVKEIRTLSSATEGTLLSAREAAMQIYHDSMK